MQTVLQVLPEGTTLPGLPYLLALVLCGLAVGALLWRRRPPVTARTVVALAPWMVVGSSLYVLAQLDAIPDIVAPLFGSPSVYVSTGILAGAVWAIAADAPADRWALRSTPEILAGTGGLAAGAVIVATLAVGASEGGLAPAWPAIGLVVSAVLAGLAWTGVRRGWPTVEVAGPAGALCVFAHALDGVSTAIGFDVLDFGERSPVSRAVLDVAAGLPTAEWIGAGWLFVAVKLALGTGVVVLLSEYVREEPAEGYLVLGFVAAVGLGPGAHNLLLFTVAP